MAGWDWGTLYNAYTEDTDGQVAEQYVVEKILSKRSSATATEYLIKWQGYPDSDNSWEPAANLACPDLLRDFERNWSKEREIKSNKPPPQATIKKPTTVGVVVIPFAGAGQTLTPLPKETNATATSSIAGIKRPASATATSPGPSATVSNVPVPSNNLDSAAASPSSVPAPPKKPRIEQIMADDKRREILEAAEKRLREAQQRGLPDSATFQRMQARKEAREKAEEKVNREGGFNPLLNWKI